MPDGRPPLPLPSPGTSSQVAELLERARHLPEHVVLRSALLFDIAYLQQAWTWIHAQRGVPAGAYAILGLTLNHLQARLSACEERAGEVRRA